MKFRTLYPTTQLGREAPALKRPRGRVWALLIPKQLASMFSWLFRKKSPRPQRFEEILSQRVARIAISTRLIGQR